MKIIIVGAGEVGFHSAQKLSEENQDVVLIDTDPEKIKRITDNLDVQALMGSGSSPETLRKAGVLDADMLVAATDSDEVNLVSCLLARHLNRYILKAARIRNTEYLREKGLFDQDIMGIDMSINPETEMVKTIFNLMMIPGACDVIDFAQGRIKLIGVTIKPDSRFIGRRLFSFTGANERLLIGAIVREEKVLIPHGNDTIKANDLVYLVARSDELNNIFSFLDVPDKAASNVIIVGAGITGTTLASALDDSKFHVKIIERDTQRCTNLSEKLKRVIVINGDGTDKNLLLEENISETDFLVALTSDEESNILISLLAKELGVNKIITRINKLSYIPLVSAVGIDTVVSSRLSAVSAILQYVRRGKIISVAPLKGEHAEAIEVEALETSDIVNTPLSKIKLPKGALIGSIIHGDEIIIPRGDSVIKEKDRLIIFADHMSIPKLEKLLTVKLDFF